MEGFSSSARRHSSRRRLALIGVLMAAAMVAAGCGSDDDDDVASTATTQRGGSTTTVAGAAGGGGSDTTAAGQASGGQSSDGDVAPEDQTLLPPGGAYTYDQTGTIESGSGATAKKSSVAPKQTLNITVTPQGEGGKIETSSTGGDTYSSVGSVVQATATEARMTTLRFRRSSPSGAPQDISWTLEPPVLVGKLPYKVGDSQDFTWSDTASQQQATGTVKVLRTETIRTFKGREVRAYVIQTTMRLQGTLTGTIDSTAWINPETAVALKTVSISDISDQASGTTHVNSTGVLTGGPSD